MWPLSSCYLFESDGHSLGVTIPAIMRAAGATIDGFDRPFRGSMIFDFTIFSFHFFIPPCF
jgi:hypothetical protein